MSIDYELYFYSEYEYQGLADLVLAEFDLISPGEYKTDNMFLTISEPDEEDVSMLPSTFSDFKFNQLFVFTLDFKNDVVAGELELVKAIAKVLSKSRGHSAFVVNGESVLLERETDSVLLRDEPFWNSDKLVILNTYENIVTH